MCVRPSTEGPRWSEGRGPGERTEAQGLDVAPFLAGARVEVAVAGLGADADRELLVAASCPRLDGARWGGASGTV